MGIKPIVSSITKTRLVTVHATRRATRGMGALTIAADGHWNSRMAGKVGSTGSERDLTTLTRLDDSLATGRLAAVEARFGLVMVHQLRAYGIAARVGIEVAVLLRPELAVHRAALEKDLMGR